MPTLDQLKIGQRARIECVGGSANLAQRIMEMGLVEGEEVEVLAFAPFGDPMEIIVREYRLSLRLAEARGVEISLL